MSTPHDPHSATNRRRDLSRWISQHRAAALVGGTTALVFIAVLVIGAATGEPIGIQAAIIPALVLLPGIIATYRDTIHETAIWLITVLLGWTVIGWIAAFIWAIVDKTPAQIRYDEARRAHMQAEAMTRVMRPPLR